MDQPPVGHTSYFTVSRRCCKLLQSLSATNASRANLRVVQYTQTKSDRLRDAPTRLAGSRMARDLENKRITRVISLQRVGKVGGSSQSDMDGHDPSLRTPTRLAALLECNGLFFNAK